MTRTELTSKEPTRLAAFTLALALMFGCAPTTVRAVAQAKPESAPSTSVAQPSMAVPLPTRPAPDYLPPAPKVDGPRIGLKEVPSQPPFVGEAGVDEHDYPLRHPDKVALLNLLRLKRFDLLDQFFTYYQERFEADFRNETWPADAASAFNSPDPEFGPLLDEWVAHSPTTFAAWLARGVHSYGVGWHVRGAKYVNLTSAAQLSSFADHLKRAAADLKQSRRLRSQLQVAAEYQLHIASAVGVDLATRRKILNDSLAWCPLCYRIRIAYQQGITPRWNGSWGAMDRFAKESATLIAKNPKLELLYAASAADRCDELRGRNKRSQAYQECANALKYGEETSALVNTAYLFYDDKGQTEALAHVERALRLDPQNRDALGLRLTLRNESADYLGAARDLVQLRHLMPTNEWTAGRVSWLVKKLTYEGYVRAKAGNEREAAPYFQLGLELDPDNADLMRRQGLAAQSDVEALVLEAASRPHDFELRLRIDHAYATQRRFDEVVELWDRFIVAHPQDPRPYVERGGAKWHLGQRGDAIADMTKACALGMAKACDDVPRMQGLH